MFFEFSWIYIAKPNYNLFLEKLILSTWVSCYFQFKQKHYEEIPRIIWLNAHQNYVLTLELALQHSINLNCIYFHVFQREYSRIDLRKYWKYWKYCKSEIWWLACNAGFMFILFLIRGKITGFYFQYFTNHIFLTCAFLNLNGISVLYHATNSL